MHCHTPSSFRPPGSVAAARVVRWKRPPGSASLVSSRRDTAEAPRRAMLLVLSLPALAMRSPTAGPRLGSLTTALATATPASADGLLAGMDATRQAKLQSMAAEADAKDLLCAGRYPWQIQDLSPWDLTFDPPCHTRLHTVPHWLQCRPSTGLSQGRVHAAGFGLALPPTLARAGRARLSALTSPAHTSHRLNSAALRELQVLHLRLLRAVHHRGNPGGPAACSK